MRRAFTVAAFLVATFLLGVPAQAAPAVANVDCARQPYGVRGCEAHLGAVVRRDQGLQLPGISDYELGRAVQRLCFGEAVPAIEASISDPNTRSLALNLRKIAAVKGGYCG
ncbi:hypothetical protein ACU61A_15600 [Pseudonocardia sichuanensis]